jgi:farnesyl diphosphate synthase
MAKQTTLEEFNSVYPKLEETLLDHARSYKLPQEQLDWYKKVILNLKLFPTS